MLPDRIELSTSPLPMECSTTELRQHARGNRIGPEGPDRRAVLATRASRAQAQGRVPGPPKLPKSSLRGPATCRSRSIGSISLPSRFRMQRCALAEWAVHALRRLVYPQPFDFHSNHSGMNDDQDKRGGQTGSPSRDSRQERLKLALRENLRRRKSQARERSDAGSASSGHSDAALDDASGKKPVQ